MHGRIYAGLALFSLLMVVGGGAQSPVDNKPVWTMESIKVKPGQFGPTLGYLDDKWMRVREEAKHQGAVVTYHRIAEEAAPDDPRTIVLLTEFKNQAAYASREKLFSSIVKHLVNLSYYKPEDLFEVESSRVFDDFTDGGVRFQLLSQN